MPRRYKIVLCDLFDSDIYGIDENSDKNIEKHYIVIHSYAYYNPKFIKKDIKFYSKQLDKILQPEIAECIILSGEETVAILKTFWIKIIQRKWKKVFKSYMWNQYLRQLKGLTPNRPNLLRGLMKRSKEER
jgi:hypothetical protein